MTPALDSDTPNNGRRAGGFVVGIHDRPAPSGGRFAAGDLTRIRHELRTPINHILGYCEMIEEEGHIHADDLPDLRKIHNGGRRLLELIAECFGEARLCSTPPDNRQLCHNLRTPVNQIIGYCEMLQERAEELFQTGLHADLQKIHAAAHLWLRRMEELLIPSDGREALQAASDAEALTPSSEPVGDSTLAPGIQADQSTPGTVLVADDDPANRDMLSRRLRREGHLVLEAENGARVLELMKEKQVDIVLLDMLMPDLDGTQVLALIKADPRLQRLPVLMVSALDDQTRVAKCLAMGADDYILKPFNPFILRSRIRACLAKKRLDDLETAFARKTEMEKQRYDDLLRILLPSEVAGELQSENTVKPRRQENVAVLFSDVVGFTQWCACHQPEEIVESLQLLFSRFESLMNRHGMEKIQTVGDCFMAAAGALGPVENPVLGAVRCAFDMVTATKNLPTQWKVHIGIHSGPVVTGIVGFKRFRFDIFGDTVNTAARIQAQAPADAVCVSKEIWNQIEPHCEGRSLGLRLMKGKQPMEIYQIDRLINLD